MSWFSAKNIKITSSHLSTEEIENKIDQGDISIFSSAIIQETAAAKEQLKAIQSRHEDFMKLEASIREVDKDNKTRIYFVNRVYYFRCTACLLMSTI